MGAASVCPDEIQFVVTLQRFDSDLDKRRVLVGDVEQGDQGLHEIAA
jgi:hypothetical protein